MCGRKRMRRLRKTQEDDRDVIGRSCRINEGPDIFCTRARGETRAGRRLVLEDEARIRAFLARAFEAEGFTVDVVGDGEQGLTLALTGSYEFIILDLLLPGRDGLDVLRQLHHHRPKLPVLILSARSDLATKLRGFELGAVGYLAKPFSLEELIARARVQMRRVHGVETGTVL